MPTQIVLLFFTVLFLTFERGKSSVVYVNDSTLNSDFCDTMHCEIGSAIAFSSDNDELLLSPGNYSDFGLIVINKNLTLTGDSLEEVFFVGDVGFSLNKNGARVVFRNITIRNLTRKFVVNVNFRYLEFSDVQIFRSSEKFLETSVSRTELVMTDFTATNGISPLITIDNAGMVKLSKCRFDSFSGVFSTVIIGNSEENIDIESSTFEKCVVERNKTESGGLSVSSCSKNLTIRDSTFVRNEGGNGGGLYIDTCPSVILENNLFEDNRGWSHEIFDFGYGGAVYVTSVFLQVISCEFSGNIAQFGGGSLFVNGGEYALVESNTFSNNDVLTETPATRVGGSGVFFEDVVSVVLRNSSFFNNSGIVCSSVCIRVPDDVLVEGCRFEDDQNRQVNSGTLSVSYALNVVTVRGCEFVNNEGTALLLSGSSGKSGYVQDCVFDGVENDYGVYILYLANIYFENNVVMNSVTKYAVHFKKIRDLIIIRSSRFVNNMEGGVWITGDAATYPNATVNVSFPKSECEFSDNKVPWNGGGLRVQYVQHLNVESSIFLNNTGPYGGAFWTGSGEVVRVNNCTFLSNKGNHGGGMMTEKLSDGIGMVLVEIKNSKFEYNEAIDSDGGGLKVMGAVVVVIENCIFGYNSAKKSGGGFYLSNLFEARIIQTGLSPFLVSRNTAGSGGGCYIQSQRIYMNGRTDLSENHGAVGGGYYFENAKVIDLEGLVLSNNTANNTGGGFVILCSNNGSILTIQRFHCNISFSSITVRGNRVLDDGPGGYDGGGGGMIKNHLNLFLRDSEFEDNYSESGFGGLHIGGSGNTYVTNCLFLRNHGLTSRGGLSIFWYSGLVVVEDSQFVENVGQSGSGIHALGEELYGSPSGIFRNNTFLNNVGTAMYVWKMVDELEIVGNLFIGNGHHLDSFVDKRGGAIAMIRNMVETLIFENNYMKGNTADKGGGVYAYACRTNYRISGCSFVDNGATYGGALFSVRGYENDYNFEFNGNVVQNNYALGGNGGGIFISSAVNIEVSQCSFLDNYAYDGSGGGLFIQYSDVVDINNSEFRNNAAKSGGGMLMNVVFLRSLFDNITFDSNIGVTGGGLFINTQDEGKDSFVSKCGKVEFSSEELLEMYGEDSNITVDSYETCTQEYSVRINSSKFVNNEAAESGGGIFSYRNTLKVVNSSFENNKVLSFGSGGGISVAASVQIEHKDLGVKVMDYGVVIDTCFFRRNRADDSGSGSSLSLTGYVKLSNSEFLEDQGNAGGSIHASLGEDILIDNCVFRDSVALDTGIVHLSSSQTTIQGCLFENHDGMCLYVEMGRINLFNSKFYGCKSGGLRVIGLESKGKESSSIKGCHIANCTAKYRDSGGGISLEDFTENKFVMEETVIEMSSAQDGCGGGLFISDMNGRKIILRNITVSKCIAEFGGGIALSNTKNLVLEGKNVISENVALVGGGSVVDLSGEMDISGLGFDFKDCQQDDYLSCFSSKPRRFYGKSIRFYDNTEFNNIGFGFNSSFNESGGDNDLGNTEVKLFPGKPFEFILNILDDYDQVVKQYPDFNCRISVLDGDFSSSTKVKLKGSYFEVALQKTEESSEENLFFSDMQIQRKMSNRRSGDDGDDNVVYIVISSDMIGEDLVYPVFLSPCPSMYYQQKQLSSEYYECLPCSRGFYTLKEDSIECTLCPEEVQCVDGKILSLPSYWAYLDYDKGVLDVKHCDNGQCSGNNECHGNFNGSYALCASCNEGYSEWNGNCTKCSGVNYLVLLGYIITVIFISMSIH